MRRVRVLVLGWLATLAFFAAAARAADELRDGDIIFQTSRSAQSVAVQRATGSRWSHMGVIVHRGGRAFVLEAAGRVAFTPLPKWTARGEGGRYVVKRLRVAAEKLTPAVLAKARAFARRQLGKPYDLAFSWSDERMYCSELVWKLYKEAVGVEIGTLAKLGDFKLDDPLVKAKLRERYGAHVPLDAPVISPAAMFDSPELELVTSHVPELVIEGVGRPCGPARACPTGMLCIKEPGGGAKCRIADDTARDLDGLDLDVPGDSVNRLER